MTQVAITLAAPHLRPHHPMRVVRFLCDFGLFEFIIECGPAAAAVVFGVGAEERSRADDAVVDSWCFGFVVLVYVLGGVLW